MLAQLIQRLLDCFPDVGRQEAAALEECAWYAQMQPGDAAIDVGPEVWHWSCGTRWVKRIVACHDLQ